MRFSLTSADLLASLPDHQVEGQLPPIVTGIASLAEAGPEDLSFLANRKYTRDVAASRAGVILLPPAFADHPRDGQAYLRVPHPSLALALICERLARRLVPRPRPGIHPSAVIAPGAWIDPTASIGPFCWIETGSRVARHAILTSHIHLGRESTVGEHTTLHAHATLGWQCEVGAHCLLHSGVVIGADGFGYESGPDGHRKVPQIGRVVIEDHVEIGANTTIDRARFAETRIGAGTKIDNLVQIGHNVRIGRHCLLCAQVGIAGSSTLGNFVVLAGQVGVTGHVHLHDRVQAGGQAGISKDWPPGTIITGSPAQQFQAEKRLQALLRALPELLSRVRHLEQSLGPAPDTPSAP